jgi:hypothetical protein
MNRVVKCKLTHISLFIILTAYISSLLCEAAAAPPPPKKVRVLHNYYVSTSGLDSNLGTESYPWKTIQKAVNSVVAGDTIYVRGGQYDGIKNGWIFQNSGSQSHPITFTNYPGEQVVLRIITSSYIDRNVFGC